MTEIVNLDGTVHATRLNSTFILEYQVGGAMNVPPVQNPYGPSRCVPSRLVVTVVTKGLALEAQRVVVQGSRAKKDGSPSLTGSEIDFWLGSYGRNDVPDWVMEIVGQAVDQVGRWLA